MVFPQCMTWEKEDYVKWVSERGEPGTWSLRDCRLADTLIKDKTLQEFEKHLQEINPILAESLRMLACVYFGSVEVDEMMTKLKCYPEWMVRPE